jgi:antitoxin HicB
MMMRYAYPARLESSDDGSILVTFRDLPEATTFGKDMLDALASATDCLDTALLIRLKRGEPVPEPSRAEPHEKIVPASLGVAAKAAFARAFAESGMTRVALAAELGLGETEIRRMLDPEHATKLDRLNEALQALGRRLVLGDMRAA